MSPLISRRLGNREGRYGDDLDGIISTLAVHAQQHSTSIRYQQLCSENINQLHQPTNEEFAVFTCLMAVYLADSEQIASTLAWLGESRSATT